MKEVSVDRLKKARFLGKALADEVLDVGLLEVGFWAKKIDD